MKKAVLVAFTALVVGSILLPLAGMYSVLVVGIVAAFALLGGVKRAATPWVVIACVIAAVWYHSDSNKPAAPAPAKAATTAPAVVAIPADDQVGRHVAMNVAARSTASQVRVAQAERAEAQRREQAAASDKRMKEVQAVIQQARAAHAREVQLIREVEVAEILVRRAHEAAVRARAEASKVKSYEGQSWAARYPSPQVAEREAREAEAVYDSLWLTYSDTWREARASGIDRPPLPRY